MMKSRLLLIDSLYINNSGGLQLLKYLVSELQKREMPFYLLADNRCLGLFDKCKFVMYMKASLWKRKQFYLRRKKCFSSVLCLGNIPAPIRLKIPVYTYFHNINLLTLTEFRTKREWLYMWMKREVFRHYKNNTDYWLVQTNNTAAELICHLKEKNDRVLIVPFFELSEELKNLSLVPHGEDYAYIANYTGAKGHEELLKAWKLLHQRGVNRTLHLTVNNSNPEFLYKIQQAQEEGVKIINHGFVPFDEVLKIYKSSKVLVYPSHNESLGLGIIEAITAGCDVIGANLPYIHAICKPSRTFNPYNVESIAEAVLIYEREESMRSLLMIHNQIDELISLLKYN